MSTRQFLHVIFLGLLVTTTTAFPQETNPTASKLESEIIHHFKFDNKSGDQDRGGATVKVPGSLEFVKGKNGMAMIAGGGKAVEITLENHIWSQKGALSLWVAPYRWAQPGTVKQRVNIVFLRFSFANGGKFILERQGFDETTKRQDLLLAGLFEMPGFNTELQIIPTTTLNWEDGKWHFVVVNWENSSFGISVDGREFQTARFPRELTAQDCPAGKQSLLQIGYNNEKSDEKTLVDELIIYKRPLTIREVRAFMQTDLDD